MIYVIATLTVKPEMKAELFAAAKGCIAATRAEKGCISYDLFESMTEPDQLVFVEEWESADLLPQHSKSDHMRAFGRVAAKCFAAPAQIEVITPEKVEKR
ncbi:MAG TPA: putative quinol monooxygenase [Terriglobales bacterium]